MENDKLKIFVSAFACMPHMGSESGVGWHWIIEMSKYFELWVLVHKEPIDDIETYIKGTELEQKIHFIYFDIPFNKIFFKNNRFRWVRTYYNIWIALSDRIVRKTMQENNIKIFHNLTFGNAIWPVSNYGQKQFFIWGPIGGLETIPSDYTIHYNKKGQLIEWIRRIMVSSLKWNMGFNIRCKNANLILCKTVSMKDAIPAKYTNKAILFTDVAVEDEEQKTTVRNTTNSHTLQYISIGRLDPWRGFDILIEAFSNALKQNPHLKLTIIGEGTDRKRLEALIQHKGIENHISIIGHIPVADYIKLISECDVVVNSCLKEGAVTVSFDSMHYGKPLICIDSGGFTRYFSTQYTIILPRERRENLVKAMEDAILRLTNEEIRKSMGNLAKEAGRSFTWKKKGEKIYSTIIQAYFNEVK